MRLRRCCCLLSRSVRLLFIMSSPITLSCVLLALSTSCAQRQWTAIDAIYSITTTEGPAFNSDSRSSHIWNSVEDRLPWNISPRKYFSHYFVSILTTMISSFLPVLVAVDVFAAVLITFNAHLGLRRHCRNLQTEAAKYDCHHPMTTTDRHVVKVGDGTALFYRSNKKQNIVHPRLRSVRSLCALPCPLLIVVLIIIKQAP